MVDIGALASMDGAVMDAAVLIGIVLAEAILLYIGYGALEELFGASVIERIRGQ